MGKAEYHKGETTKVEYGKSAFQKEVAKIAVPVALQSMLSSSFSMVDQIMVGQLGKESIGAVEIAGKPSFIYAFMLGAIGTVAGIMISQYIGKKDRVAEERSVWINLLVGFLLGVIFTVGTVCFAGSFVRIFSEDVRVLGKAQKYLQIIGWSFLPMSFQTILGTAIRCRGKSSWPMYVAMFSAVLNTGLNYCLIFGRFGFPTMGIEGAAVASIISQVAGAALMIGLFLKLYPGIRFSVALGREGYVQYVLMFTPIMVNEFLWTIGQSVNTYVYGHMGTDELAGMSLTSPVQGLIIGALSGLAQAAGILIGKRLGERNYDQAYRESKRICLYGLVGSLFLSGLLVMLRMPYVQIYKVGDGVHNIGGWLLVAFALLTPVKVANMILGGGIIRSGGKTKYIMLIDMFGTWGIGVPLALITGLVLKLPIFWVYLILSQEELVRLVISVFMFRSRKWMHTIA